MATVRPCREEDIAAVTAIYGDAVLNGTGTFQTVPPDEAAMRGTWQEITARGLPFLVAEDERGEILGYSKASVFRDRAAYDWLVEDAVYVAEDHRGKGIGEDLLAALIARCTEIGKRQMIALVGGSDNRGSIRLHEKLGFRQAGVIGDAGFKQGRWLDVVIMQRALGEGGDTLPDAAGQPPSGAA